MQNIDHASYFELEKFQLLDFICEPLHLQSRKCTKSVNGFIVINECFYLYSWLGK